MEKGYIIDLILLNKFQKVSDWIHNHFGYNNFAIAKFLRVAMVVALLLREVISFLNGIGRMEIIVIACSMMIIIKMKLMAYNAEQSLKNKNGLMNPAVNQYSGIRIIMQFVAMAAFGFLIIHLYSILNPSFTTVVRQYDDWKELFWDVFGILIFPVTYFSSCTPRPYNPGKARKFINSPLRQNVTTVTLKKALP